MKEQTETPSLRYLEMLSRQYPTVQAASTEIVNLQAILNLPKGTEHFLSDVHGEYEAFLHILNSASGVVREKVDEVLASSVSKADRDELVTLIYYPAEKLEEVQRGSDDMEEWYRITLHRLIDVCRLVTSKYTRSKVRKAMPKEYAYIIDELLNTNYEFHNKREYYENIISTIIDIDRAGDFVVAMCELIKRTVTDHLHVVGDVFDRGPRADIIMDSLLAHHSVDIQWGNHDVLWMGAATGSRTLVATVLSNSIHYNNLEVIETGYGISLRPLALFANEVYRDTDCSCFAAKLEEDDAVKYNEKDILLAARMHKAITVILFKLEGQKILRNPGFGMEERLLLDKIDYEHKTIAIGGKTYQLQDVDFPTVDRAHPYDLSPEEDAVMDQLTKSFRHSEKLQRHVRFLYSKGGIYKVYNGNLLLHGCIPMTEDGRLTEFTIGSDRPLAGRAFLDHADAVARQAYYAKLDSRERQFGMDFLWFLWAGKDSPLFGRARMTTFERRLIKDESSWTEEKNAYYKHYNDPKVCESLLAEFGLSGPHCHIINGHMPVKSKKGESPIKGGGKLVVIDGGFCRAYQPTTGIAGYTLIYNSECLRIVSHKPFDGKEKAIRKNKDISSSSVIFERMDKRIKISETDIGIELQRQADDLKALLRAYRSGAVKEDHRE
ncbi:MAG TPA: fructose-1,6-bisphosphatase [Pseudoflavonifractor sp.]|nr:fructose-1,6-bisphosphatase [Pseudoflavonifractor sp.]